METITLKETQENFLEVLGQVQTTQGAVRITSEVGNWILLPEESYQNLLVTLELLSIPGFMKSFDPLPKQQEEAEAL